MITLKDIQDARKNLGPFIHKTPLFYSNSLSKLSGAEVYLKLENLQKTGSFKVRGASGNCSHRIEAPGGQREGSSATGWPTQIVGVAGSMPRSASLAALDTPSSPGVR